MRSIIYALLCCFSSFSIFAQQKNALPIFTEPSLSPDGKEIAFISGGDIWTVSLQGGEARLLIAQDGFESRPLYSPNGEYIAFTSTKTGNGDIYVFSFRTGEIKRLTFDDGIDDISGWSPDSKFIYFASSGKEISSMADVFRISATGGTPMPILDEPYTSEFFASASPDGSALAFNARGVALRQWWRNGHSHLDESEIWIRREGKNASFEQITPRGAKEIWPMWSKDGNTIFYVSDRDGKENLWSKQLNGNARQLTNFRDGRLLWPNISLDGNTIVFERNLGIWKYNVATQKSEQIAITKRGAVAPPSPEHLRLNNQFNSLTLSPDGKKIAFIARGEIFASSAKEGGDAARITNTVEEESDPIWSPDSKSLVYVSGQDGASHLYRYDFASRTTKKLTSENLDDEIPVFSPDGKSIAFIRNGRELRVLDMTTAKDRLVAKGYFGRGPFSSNNGIAWSPDSKWIAYAAFGNKAFRNIYVVPAAGGTAKPISFVSNAFGGAVIWSPDGKYILFNTRQRTENGQVARIDLVPKTPLFSEDKFQEMFTEPIQTTDTKVQNSKPADKTNAPKDTIAVNRSKPSSKDIQIKFDGIQQRLTLLPIGMDVNDMSVSKDGKSMLLIANVAGNQNIYTYSLDELAKQPPVATQITTTTGGKSFAQFTADAKEVFYMEQGRIFKVTLENKQTKPLDVTAELDVDFTNQKLAVFQQAWEIQNETFYDSTFHGADWKSVRKMYEPYVAGAQTSDELRRIMSLMIGELNASHSGVSAPGSSSVTSTGRIGLKFDRTEYESTGKLKISSVTALSPADVVGTIKVGDYLVAVDDTVIMKNMNLDQLLNDKINKRIALSISATGSPKDARKVFLRPVNQATDKRLLYRQWVQQQRDYVHKVSGGRLGYVHMYDMSAESLNQYYLDLDAENHAREGVVVDIRNNNGGFVNAYALDVLSRQGYMNMTVRGLPTAPARTQLGQRALEAPTVLVTNQHSLSDAEDFTEGYKTMKLGKVVGEPTSGWIIYTSGTQLLDGTNMRLPFIKITDHEGKNMELAPRQVDVPVTRPIGESAKNMDSQLDTAVKQLLQQLDGNKPSNTRINTSGK